MYGVLVHVQLCKTCVPGAQSSYVELQTIVSRHVGAAH